MFRYFEPRGTLEGWKKTASFYNREHFELHQFVVGTSFGSPLVALTPINAVTLHLHGLSGVGKTTAMKTGLAIWGDPSELITDALILKYTGKPSALSTPPLIFSFESSNNI